MCGMFVNSITIYRLIHITIHYHSLMNIIFNIDSGPSFGTVCHIPMHPTFCKETSNILVQAAEGVMGKSVGLEEKKLWSPNGTVVTIEGPRFSTKAESLLFKSWNCDVINMTTGNN